jgi:uroporphyrinogen-III synthase
MRRVLVTRPEPQASQWAAQLQARLQPHGLSAVALPLIAIGPPPDPQAVHAVRATWQHLDTWRALMFVSPAAVEWFFRQRPDGARWPDTTLATAPGPGTARALQDAAAAANLPCPPIVSPSADAAQFDSEALWPLLRPFTWQGQKVCILSGGDAQDARGRTWLTEQWQAQGAQVQTLLTYCRSAGDWSAAEQALARAALADPAGHVWLVSSSQALDHLRHHHLPALCGVADGASLPAWPQLRLLCTHPRIAEHARELGLTRLQQTRPTVDAVVQALRPTA